MVYIIGRNSLTIKIYHTAVRHRYSCDDTNEGALTGTIGTKKSIYGTSWHLQRDIVQRPMSRIALRNMLYAQYCIHNLQI